MTHHKNPRKSHIKKKKLSAVRRNLLNITNIKKRARTPSALRPPRVGQVKNKPKKLGYIYFIEAGPFVKIGWSGYDGSSRISDMQVGCPYELKLLGICRMRLSIQTERALHYKFRAYHFRGEWFTLSEEIKRFVQSHCRPEAIAKAEAKALAMAEAIISHNQFSTRL